MPRSRHSSKYSGTRFLTSSARKAWRSSTPSIGIRIGSSALILFVKRHFRGKGTATQLREIERFKNQSFQLTIFFSVTPALRHQTMEREKEWSDTSLLGP